MSNWPEIVMPEVAFFQEGPGLRKWQWTDSGMKVINVTNILGDGRVDLRNTDRFISQEEFDQKYRHFAIQPRDILVASSGNTYGKVGRIHADQLPVMMNTSVIRFHSADQSKLNDDFLYAFLRSTFFKTQVEAFVIGSAQPNFGPTHIKRMNIRLPPLDVQQRIAGILSAYDDLIEVNTRRITILEEMARRLFDEWFIKCRFPGKDRLKEAEEVPLRAVADFVKGRKPEETKQAPSRGDVPLLLIDALRGGRPVFTSPVGLVLVEKRDTIMVMDGGSSCDVALGFSGALGSTLGRFRTIDGARFSNHALYRFLESKVDEFKLKNIGSAIPHANKDYILQQRVKLLPRGMNEKLDSLLEPVQAAAEVLRSANQQLRAARDLLLPKLISGEIDVSGTKRQAKRAVKRAAAE